MFQLGAFVAEIFLLYVVSRRVLNRFYSGIYSVTKSKRITLWLFALFFWIGTVIHELSHWVVASLLGVGTGKVSLGPKFIGHDQIELGSVQIINPGLLKRFVIGVAPMILGIFLIVFGVYFANLRGVFDEVWRAIIAGYLVFAVGNTMFSSKQDLDGAWKVLIIILAVIVSFWLIGVSLNTEIRDSLYGLIGEVNKFLLIPIVIDLSLLGLFYLIGKE